VCDVLEGIGKLYEAIIMVALKQLLFHGFSCVASSFHGHVVASFYYFSHLVL